MRVCLCACVRESVRSSLRLRVHALIFAHVRVYV